MKKELLLSLCIIFAAMFGFGASFMEYEMLNPTANTVLTVVGLIGMLITGIKLCKG